MIDNYAMIVKDNVKRLYDGFPTNLNLALPARSEDDSFLFEAFGEKCAIRPEGIFLAGTSLTGVTGILISLYALHANNEACRLEPLKAFKDFPNTMPYAGAFVTHTQQILVPHVDIIKNHMKKIQEKLSGCNAPVSTGCDFSFIVYPLPKIALCYIFYEADEDFPASVTCLYSNNADVFLPIDALADVGEYTSKKILQIIDG